MADLIASGNSPGTQYQPSETGGVYHEDREVTASGGPGSQMFRVYGAQFNPTAKNWSLQSPATSAYATVQNPNGSIHYFTSPTTSPWTTSEWIGSDNNTMFNIEDFGVAASGGAANNTAALLEQFTSMAGTGLGGGISIIPQRNFAVNASSTGLAVPDQAIFQAYGTGGQNGEDTAFHFSINDPSGATAASIFFNASGTHTSGGTYFNNIAFQWKNPGFAGDTSLVLGYWNSTARDCTFTDCPIALNVQGLGSLVDHCTISYGETASDPTSVTAVLVNAISCEISGPSEFNGGQIGGTSTCMSIGGGVATSNGISIRRVHMTGFSYALDYSDRNNTGIGSGTQDNVISECVIDAPITSIYVSPRTSSGQIFNQKLVDNTITKGQDSTNGSPIIYIDSNGGVSSNIGPIDLLNNTIYSDVTGGSGQQPHEDHVGVAQNNQYGVQIGTCGAVRIIGGQISQMGGNNGTTGSANVYISGDPSYVLLEGVDLSAVYAGANAGNYTGSTGSGPSYYGILIDGNPSEVRVNDCNLTGVTVPLSVTIVGEEESLNLLVTNCPGYNDQNTVVNTLSNITTGVAYSAATQGGNHGTSYWGPSFVMFTANASGGTFQYNGGAAQSLLPSQVVCLTLASPNDTIQFNNHAPAAFSWIGK